MFILVGLLLGIGDIGLSIPDCSALVVCLVVYKQSQK